MAWQHRVPNLLPWLAHRNQEDSRDDITNDATPDSDMDSYKHDHVTSPNANEDSEILKEDSKLDEEDSRAIEDSCKVNILEALSVSNYEQPF